MPKQRRLEGFAPVFDKITRKAVSLMPTKTLNDECIMRIPCQSQGENMNVQMQLRQYWLALDMAIKSGEIPEYDARAAMNDQVRMLACRTSKTDKRVCEILHRDQLGTARAIANSLGALEQALEPEPEAKAGEPRATTSPLGSKGAQEKALEERYGPVK